MKIQPWLLLVFITAPLAGENLPPASPGPALMAEINKIQAVDSHTHVPKVVGRGEKDLDFDALPCSGYLEPSDDPAMARPDNPLFLDAWRKLYG